MNRASFRVQLRLPFATSDSQRGDKKSVDVEAALRRLLNQDLTFKGEKTAYATHNIHAFAAKFPPPLPNLFIRELTHPGEWVLDPMVGSGTTVVEAILNERHCIGTDLDPLAAKIARVKSTPPDLPSYIQASSEVLQRAQRLWEAGDRKLDEHYPPAAINFFHYWFQEHTVAELHALVQAIQVVRDPEICGFLQVVFSSMIITKSGGVTLARDLAHSRPHRDLNKQVDHNAFEVFRERAQTVLQSLESLVGITGQGVIIHADARRLPLRDDSVHLVFTSPPYAANAIDYMRAHKFSLIWLGYSPDALATLRRQYIGAEIQAPELVCASETANQVLHRIASKDKRRAAVIARYFLDMEATLKEILRVLISGRAAVLVAGSSTIRGVDIRAPTVLAELAGAVGFRVVDVTKREIVRDARMMPVSHNSHRAGIEARMHEEGVIGLIKP